MGFFFFCFVDLGDGEPAAAYRRDAAPLVGGVLPVDGVDTSSSSIDKIC